MSCIIVSVERVGEPMEVSADRIGSPMEVAAHRIGKPMEVSARLVCTINGEFYMRVSPDVIWLDPNDATVFVESNVNWIIE